MLLAQLELNESAEVEFGIEIHGTSERTSDIRFIIEGPSYGIVCKCREENGTVTATIPKLKGILPAGQFEARLEVVLDGKYFMPLKESIEFKPLVEFDITSAKSRPTGSASVNTTAVKVRVIENPEKENTMRADEFVPNEKDEPSDDSDQENDSTESKQPTKAKPAAKSEGTSEGNKPAMTWDQIVKKSITNPKNAPKIEKGDFDYNNVSNATPELKSSNKSAGTDTATTGLPPQGKDSSSVQPTSTKQSAPGQKKNVDKNRAKQILDKINGFKSTIDQIRSQKKSK